MWAGGFFVSGKDGAEAPGAGVPEAGAHVVSAPERGACHQGTRHVRFFPPLFLRRAPCVPQKLRGRPLLCVQYRQFRAIAYLACVKLTVLYANRGAHWRIGRPLGRYEFGSSAFPQVKAQRSAAPCDEALVASRKRPETRTKPSTSCRHAYLLHENDGFVRNGMEGGQHGAARG